MTTPALARRFSQRGRVGLKMVGAIAGAVLSIALVSTVFVKWHWTVRGLSATSRFSFAELAAEIPRNLRWLWPFALLTALMTPLRAIQWQTTLRKNVRLSERYHLVAIAGLANNVIPGKLGDVIRAWLLARDDRELTFVESLGSVAVCKLLELAALMLLVIVSFVGPGRRVLAPLSHAMKPALLGCAALIGVVIGVAHYAQPLALRLRRARRWPKAQRFLEHLGAGLGAARSFPGMGLALLFSVGPVLAAALAYGMGLSGLGVKDGVAAGAAMLGAIYLGQTAIAVPAGPGIYYFVTAWAARALGASAGQAAIYAALTHLATVGTQIAMGAVSIWVRKIRWSDLKRRASVAAEEARHLDDDPVEATG